jgi:predicted RNA-binding protein with RPS1 domain
MQVKVIAVDDQDRVKLSRKQVLREQKAKEGKPEGDQGKGDR